MDLQVGDVIELKCKDKSSYLPDSEKIIVGIVVNIFDALTSDLQEGINLQIDIRGFKGEWFRYKPMIDGGTIKILRRGKNG